MHLSSILKRPLYLLLPSLMLTPFSANAARVLQANAKSVILQMDSGESLSTGQTLIVMVGGKKKAFIEITKISGSKAAASIKKSTSGNLVGGTTVVYAGKGGGGSTASNSRNKRRGRSSDNPFGDLTVGGLLGYSMDSQTVNGNAMSGSGLGLKGFGDVPISGGLGAIARAGFEQFNAAGGTVTGKTSITYLTTDLLVRYTFLHTFLQPFVAGGVAIHFPLSKTSTALDVSKISATSVFLLDGGGTYTISDTMYAIALLEYGMFPPSNSVSTHFISLRGGVGWKF